MAPRLALVTAVLLLCACGASAGRVDSTGSVGSTLSADSTPGAAPPVGSAPVAPCGPMHAVTLAQSRLARVYATGSRVFGCARGRGTAYMLGQRRTCLGSPRVAPVVVSARRVAYGEQRCGVDTGSATVVVRRLTDGGILAQQSASTTSAGPESYTLVSAIVLASDGAVAWISEGQSIVGHRQVTEVHALDRHGARRLDRGPGIVAGSLRLRGSMVSWLDAGRRRAARLA